MAMCHPRFMQIWTVGDSESGRIVFQGETEDEYVNIAACDTVDVMENL